MILFGVVLAAIAVSATITNQQVERVDEQVRIANSISQGASELGYLAGDYLVYRESQQLNRWQTRFASFSSEVASLQPDDPGQQALVGNIQANTQRLGDVFDSVVSAIAGSSQDQSASIDLGFLQVSWSRLAVQSQGLASDSSQLALLLEDQADRLQRTSILVVAALIGVFVAFLLVTFSLFQRRTLQSIAKLQAGATVIGSGNLDYRVEEKKNDEIGDLARAFNRMAASLKQETASKTELENEIAKRNELQEALLVSNESLQEQAIKLENEIVERKKAEEALRESQGHLHIALDSARLGTFDYNPGTRRLIWDEQTKRMHGIPLDEQPDYAQAMELIHADDRNQVQDALAAALDPMHGGYYEAEYRIVCPDGSVHWNQTKGRVYFKGRGRKRQAVRLVGVNYDITDRKKVDSIKDEFIGLVSHELRTPLTVVIGSLHTARDERLPPEDRSRLLEDAAWGAQSLDSILSNLLELSRYQADRLSLEKKPVNIREICLKTVQAISDTYPKHSISLDFDDDLQTIIFDPVRMARIFHNLIDNACKYSPEGGEVRVFARQYRSEIVIGVSDHGVGITEEDQEDLFEPFSRLGQKTRTKGIGLGLVVCKRLVEAHGGRIWVESKPGEGSTFLFGIPLEEDKAAT
jgi:signal transduction histidine kinase